MKKIFLILILKIIVLAANAQQKENGASFPTAQQFNNSKITFKIIDAPNGTFGYDIFSDDKLMFHQPSIPAMPGNEGFKTKSDAEKVAQLVIDKIKKGEMPPTVSPKEMKDLHVIK